MIGRRLLMGLLGSAAVAPDTTRALAAPTSAPAPTPPGYSPPLGGPDLEELSRSVSTQLSSDAELRRLNAELSSVQRPIAEWERERIIPLQYQALRSVKLSAKIAWARRDTMRRQSFYEMIHAQLDKRKHALISGLGLPKFAEDMLKRRFDSSGMAQTERPNW